MKFNYKVKKWLVLGLVLVYIGTAFGSVKVSAGESVPGMEIEYDGMTHTYDTRLVDIQIDDQIIETGDMPAVVVDSRTLVPVREVFEHDLIGAEVLWDGDKEQVHITYQDQYIIITINSTVAYVNGEQEFLDVPAKLIRDTSKQYPKTMIPLRFVAEQMGYTVEWDGEDYVANLYTETYLANQEESKTENPLGTNEFKLLSKIETLDERVFDNEVVWHNDEGTLSQFSQTGLTNNAVSISAGSQLAKSEVTVNVDEDGVEADFVEIYNLKYYYEEGTPEKVTFEVSADGPISDVITSVEDGVFELYILKATLDMNTTSFEYDDHPYIDALSITQYTGGTTGNQNCLIKFDLNKTGLKFNVRYNELRAKIYVDVVMDHISQVNVGQNNSGDYIDLIGVSTDRVDGYRVDKDTLNFDIDITNTMVDDVLESIDGSFIESVSITQKDTVTTSLNVKLKQDVQYTVEPGNGSTRIQFMEPTYKNMNFTMGETSAILLKDVMNFDDSVDKVSCVDDYLNHQFVVTLPGNLVEHFGTSNVEIDSEDIDAIAVALNNEGNTEVVISTNLVKGYMLQRVGDDLLIEAKNPGQVYDRIITIDPGHGGYKPGAYYFNVYEKEINLQVTHVLKNYLDADESIKAYYIRLEDEHMELADRMVLANEVESDLFVSLHSNSFYTVKTGSVSLYYTRENGTDMTNKAFATIMQNNYTSNTEFVDKNITYRDDLYVLKYATMPAMLLEMGYMSNPLDLDLLLDDEHQERMAEGIYKGIVEGFEMIGL